MRDGLDGRRVLLFAAAAGLFAGMAVAAGPADIVKARQAGYHELGAAFKNVNDELRSPTPQIMIIRISAREIGNYAKQQYGWFPTGSGPQPGIKTGAKPEIWAQPAQFKAAQDLLVKEAGNFMTVAAAGDMTAIKAQARTLGQACGSCHRAFRVEQPR